MSTSCARRMMTNSGCLCDSRMEFGLSSAKHKFCSSLSLNAAFSNKRVFDEVNMSVRKTLPLLGDVDSAKKPMSQYTHSVVFKPKIRLGRSQGVPAQAASGAEVGFEDSSIELSPYQSKVLEFITSERAKVIAMVALGMSLCNADRVVLSVAIVPLASTNGWNSYFSGIVQSFFLWGYLISPIAGGALADRYGGKRVMAWGVAIWSLATLLTPWAANHSLGMLLAVRTLFGMAEGVALPCMNTMISRWFPCTERAKAVGLSMAGFHLGNVISLLASPIIMSQTGVFGPFVIFGFLGFLWLSVWTYAISNNPESHPGIAKSEVLYIQDGNKFSAKSTKKPLTEGGSILPPFRLLLSKLPTWAIIIANLTNNWGYFVLLSWMPVYFNTVFGINLKEAAWFSAIPWATMAAVGYVAGAFSDFLIQSGLNITLVRKIMQSIGFLGPGVALLGLNAAQTPSIASAWLTVALGLSAFSQAGFLLNMQDIAPQYAGVLHGMTNTVGTMAAIVSTIGIGFFVQWLGSFQSFLTLTAVLYFASALWWDLFATGERVFK